VNCRIAQYVQRLWPSDEHRDAYSYAYSVRSSDEHRDAYSYAYSGSQ
jgi:hypothetical protein